MKNLLFLLLATFSLSIVAQDKLTEGVIMSKMTMSSESEPMKSQFAMIGDMNLVTYFKNNKTRSELSNPMTGETATIIDKDSNKLMTMMSNPMMGKKYSISDIVVSKEDLEGIEVTKGDVTKTILGYECQQYKVVMNKEGASVKMNIFSTEKIQASSQQTESLGDKFKGFPLYMTMDVSQAGMEMVMTYEITEVKKETVEDSLFDMTPPEGYEKTDNIQGM